MSSEQLHCFEGTVRFAFSPESAIYAPNLARRKPKIEPDPSAGLGGSIVGYHHAETHQLMDTMGLKHTKTAWLPPKLLEIPSCGNMPKYGNSTYFGTPKHALCTEKHVQCTGYTFGTGEIRALYVLCMYSGGALKMPKKQSKSIKFSRTFLLLGLQIEKGPPRSPCYHQITPSPAKPSHPQSHVIYFSLSGSLLLPVPYLFQCHDCRCQKETLNYQLGGKPMA